MNTTRTREQGTIDYCPATQEERISAFRNIVESQSYAKIDGCMIDVTSANVVVKIYDALNENNKLKFSSLTAENMAKVAFKLIK